jgi:UPF0755 protein
MLRALKCLFFLFCICLISLTISPYFVQEPSIIKVEKGMSARDIFHTIKKNNIFSHLTFVFQGLSFFYQKKYHCILPGVYHIPKNASILKVLHILVTEKQICKIKIPEGWTVCQILEKIKKTPSLSGPYPDIPKEGSWFPDTYHYTKGTCAKKIAEQMVFHMKKNCDLLTKKYKRPSPLQNDQEWIILASIIERETPQIFERAKVASVYLNRLRKKMRLQADPTVIYGLSHFGIHRALTKEDLRSSNPYNTYQNEGLPPTPICCPSKASLEAVLTPARSSDLFFVANGSGGHTFSKSFEEHKKNVRRWRKIEKDNTLKNIKK